MRVEVDRTRCISNGRCLRLAPDVFEWDFEGVAYVKDAAAAAAEPDAVRSAELACPARAIHVTGHAASSEDDT